ncbi:MAG: DNA-J related domain-containing protein [Thioalkalispiraceae bacterium]|jgi:hypothetical protein
MAAHIEQITTRIQQLSRILEKDLPLITPCTEHTLLTHLKALPETGFAELDSRDPHQLFQLHFLLFHVLYRLRDQYRQQHTAHLEISPLHIALLPYQAGEQGLSEADPLRDYYLDLSHLHSTSRHEVDEMLGRFWSTLGRDEHRAEALAVLGLSDPVDEPMIRKTYQKLVMQHHPDRGGDKLKLQELNLAMDVLLRK